MAVRRPHETDIVNIVADIMSIVNESCFTQQVTYVNKEGVPVASVDVPVDRYIYFATEDSEVDVPIVNKKRMCRNGCCTTCAVKVLEGKVRTQTLCA